MNNQAFSKILIAVLLIVFISGGILAWEYWKIPKALKGFLVYDSFEGKKENPCTNIFLKNLETGKIEKISEMGSSIFAVSPDNQKMIYTDEGTCFGHFPGRESEVHLYNFRNRESKTLKLKNLEGFVWSPDGKEILFNNLSSGDERGIFKMNSDGTNPKKIIEEGSDLISYSWSPDSKYIVYSNFFEIFKADRNGKNKTKLLEEEEGVFPHEPVWSPNAEKIVFVKNPTPGAEMKLYIMNLDGSEIKRITDFEDYIREITPVWSPDGKFIAFEIYDSKKKGRTNIAIANLETKETKILTTDGGAAPAWSPDSTSLVYISGKGKITIINIESEKKKIVVSAPGTVHKVLWLASK